MNTQLDEYQLDFCKKKWKKWGFEDGKLNITFASFISPPYLKSYFDGYVDGLIEKFTKPLEFEDNWMEG